MFTWPQIILLLLQLVKAFMGEKEARRNFTAGQDAEIAKESTAILRKTEAGKKMLEKIEGMSDAEVDDFIDNLVGTVGGGSREG